ncbi:MAG TPA: carboxypeptidase-like regulatory domain-containing protein [Terracidiphilus sp.]|nr:carboxypeptidase-like regulatory domain-containing protein [Terracidiphilus sp.]
MKLKRVWLAACAIFFTLGVVSAARYADPMVAFAQNIGQRSVSGAVVDGESNPLPSATIFLKNQKTKAIRSYTSGKDGRFRFAQVNMAEDFDLWAEKDGHKSAIKTVSSWDARKEYETELRMK